jgi:S-DNA-T family DNA segregation ATPase FtsK/SpoIIIE
MSMVKRTKEARKGHQGADVTGAALILIALLLGASLFTYRAGDPSLTTSSLSPDVQNALGRVGAFVSDLFFQLFGIGAYLFPAALVAWGGLTIWKGDTSLPRATLLRFTLWFLCIMWVGTLLFSEDESPANGGGIIGRLVSDFLLHYFSATGRIALLLSSLFLITLWTFSIPLRHLVHTLITRKKTAPAEAVPPLATPEPIPPVAETPGETPEETAEDQPSGATVPIPHVTARSATTSVALRADLEGEYQLPPLSLLSDPSGASPPLTEEEWVSRSRLLEQKLLDFDISGRITEIHPGPVVTMFEFEPAPGIKLNRITNLSDDLALAMKASQVRIVAPLPWKSTVGMEIPNLRREEVLLKEVLSSPSFAQYHSKTRLALGKDIFGTPASADLASMPHLLIAGSTGSGKSVGMNAMILSILFSATPLEVKILMIDPKMLEFTLYNGIPHLIAPVIVRPKGAAMALRKMVLEMQRRYELLSEKGVRNIDAYNRRIKEEPAKEGIDPTPPLPYIVIFIDELADLMMVAAKDVEDSITRLAQMARAAGIHLVLATQRPSVDVITGLIKANFPARIAYRVATKTDSRTVLDANGAEKMLGHGDMLYLAPGTGTLTRIHGAYVSEEEVKKVVEFIKKQAKPAYEAPFSEEALMIPPESDTSDERDEMYENARELVLTHRQASASFIQRKLRIGYPRAARMIELMEEDGLIGPANGAKPREIFDGKTETSPLA